MGNTLVLLVFINPPLHRVIGVTLGLVSYMTTEFLAGRPAFSLFYRANFHEISLLCPGFFIPCTYNTFLLRPAMFREIQRRVPLLPWLKLACMPLN